jgi:predicted metal-binding protein
MHIQAIVARARELGADRAAPLPARAVVVDERVNFKCRVPLCSHYGVNLMCPPNVPTPAETRGALARYSDTLVVQRDIPLTQDAVDEALAGMGYAEANAVVEGAAGAAAPASSSEGRGGAAVAVAGPQTAAYEASLTDSQNEFARLMTALESAAFKMGYRFATAFAGGDCVLCDVCVGKDGEACRHPFEARPSMEAVGIDVVATADAAGLAIEMPAADRPCWTGLLLID